ncbi:MAG: glycerophosphodiester phosphodiesterase family protein [Patescibacteria group bacterium]
MIKIGHRGACGHKPENTLSSFAKAIELGADMVECDVYLSRDDVPVVIHEPIVDKTTDGHGRVADLTVAELKRLKIKPNETIPTLQEVIDLIKGRCRLNAEMKDIRAAEKIAELLTKNKMIDASLITSNNRPALVRARKINPRLKIGWVFWTAGTDFRQFFFRIFCYLIYPYIRRHIITGMKDLDGDILSIDHYLLSSGFIRKLKKENISIYAWVVNRPAIIRKMKEGGVAGIISNYPDRL